MMKAAGLQLALSLALLVCAQLSAAQNFTLPPLPYTVSALEPIIDTQTMTFHHDIHHNNYVVALNNVLATQRQIPSTATLTDIVSMVGTRRLRVTADVETTIRNQAGGAWNHAMFWKVMAPANSSATTLPANNSALGQAVINNFGSFSALISRVNAAAAGRFGSGWAWVVYRPRNGGLEVVDSANQDCPLMGKTPLIPILGVDVWEHAYYLKHGPRRATYMQNWWQVANWQQIAANYETARAGTDLEPLVGAAANRRS